MYIILLTLLTSSALAGNNGSGMSHDPMREQRERQVRMDVESNRRKVEVEEHKARHILEQRRLELERSIIEKAEWERQQAREANDKARREWEEKVTRDAQRRREFEQKRREEEARNRVETLDEILNAMNQEQDPILKEYWATMVIMLDPNNQEAITFLRDVRGWTQEEINNLTGRK